MIGFNNEDLKFTLKNKRLIRKWLQEVAKTEGNYQVGDIQYVFTSSENQRNMNIQYLGHDYFTDIITFDYSSLKDGVISGDIYIDIPTVVSNSEIYGTPETEEIYRVIVHGVLHLCGQNDKSEKDNKEMHRKEDVYLSLLKTMAEKR